MSLVLCTMQVNFAEIQRLCESFSIMPCSMISSKQYDITCLLPLSCCDAAQTFEIRFTAAQCCKEPFQAGALCKASLLLGDRTAVRLGLSFE